MNSFITQMFSASRMILRKQLFVSSLKRWSPRGRIPQNSGEGEEISDYEDHEFTQMQMMDKKPDRQSFIPVDRRLEQRFDSYDDDIDEGIQILQRSEHNRKFNKTAEKRASTFQNKGDDYVEPQRARYNKQNFAGRRSQFENEHKYVGADKFGEFHSTERNENYRLQRDRYQKNDDYIDHKQVRNDFGSYRNNSERRDFGGDRGRYRENYNEGYGPPENRFEHRKKDSLNYQRKEYNPRTKYGDRKLKYDNRDPIDRLFEDENTSRERLLLPNPYRLTEENKNDIVNEIASPWYKYSYEQQLIMIHSHVSENLRYLGSKIKKVCPDFRLTDRGYPCYLDPTIGCTETIAYRTRSEFSIWPGMDGNPKTVGFLVGKPSKHESVICLEPDNTAVLKKNHVLLAKLFQDYLRSKSPLEVSLHFSDGKHWRNLVVRSNDNNDHMMIAVLNNKQLTSQLLDSEIERIRNHFEPLANEHKIKSFYVQTVADSANENAQYRLVFGEPAIEESLGVTKFLISPQSFFYANKSGGEKLSQTVLKMLELSDDLTVLDISLTCGLFSLQTAPFVKKVIGSQLPQFGDACSKNVELNNLKNVSYYNLTLQDLIEQQREELWDKDVTVIVSPTMDGLNSAILPQLRSMKCVKKLVYVTPRPPTRESKCLKNLFHLMIPQRRDMGIEGAPFVAVNAVPYDVMPHTPHFGVVFNLERQSRFSY